MKILETRTTQDGFKRRRYLYADGRRLTTIEIPLRVWNAVGKEPKKQNRIKREALKARALELLDAGWKPLAVSSELDVPVRTLQRWKIDPKGAAK